MTRFDCMSTADEKVRTSGAVSQGISTWVLIVQQVSHRYFLLLNIIAVCVSLLHSNVPLAGRSRDL